MLDRWGQFSIGNYQFILWPSFHIGFHEWDECYWPVYGRYAFWIGPLEIRRFTKGISRG